MNFEDISSAYEWEFLSGQDYNNVTYVVVASKHIPRLWGESNILYVGFTKGAIRNRYKQQTTTRPRPRSSQNTNTRNTHVLKRLEGMGITHCVYFVQESLVTLEHGKRAEFDSLLESWVISVYNADKDRGYEANPPPSLERYLLVKYANEHLELPPLNNRF